MAKRQQKKAKAKIHPSSKSVATGRGFPAIPVLVPTALFVVLTAVLFREFIFSDQMLFGSDTLGLGFVARDFYANALKDLGVFPRWSPNILGGMPFIEALSSGDSLYPPSALLLLLMDTHRALGWKLVLHVLAAGFFMFGWIRILGGSRPAAMLAGTAYLVAPFLVTLIHPGHDGKLFVTALAPLLFWTVERHYARGGMASWSGIGLVVALVLYTTHFQMAYFLFGGVGLYAIFRAAQLAQRPMDAELRTGLPLGFARFATFLGAAILGAAAAGVQFLPAVDYVTEYSRRVQTTRDAAGEAGRAWSSSWSMHPEEAMSQIIPEFAGNSAGGSEWTEGTYWGRNDFKNNHEYAGVVVLLLAAVSFLGAARKGVRWFFTGLGLLAFLFALGAHTPIWGFFYALLPGIRYFRAPSQVVFLFGFAVITLAALGLDRILEVARDDNECEWRRILQVVWSGAGLMVVLAALASSGALTSLWTSVVYSDVDPGRLQRLEVLLPYLGRGAWMGALMLLATAGLVWAVRRTIVGPAALVVGVVTLAAVDGMRVDVSFIQLWDYQQWSTPDPNIRAVLELQEGDPEPYRMYSLVGGRDQDVMPALHGIELVAGHHPNDMARYRELIGMVGSGQARNLADPDIRRLLNVRYLLWPDIELGPPPDGTIVAQTQLADGRPYQTVLRDVGLPRARLLSGTVVKSDEEAVQYMLTDEFDPFTEVVLNEPAPIVLNGGPVRGQVTWAERTPNHMRLSVSSDRPALLVIADNWFPAWHATVDGTEVPILRAYHTLRAVPVPAGDHTVEMFYRSHVVNRSLVLSIVTIMLLIGAAAFGIQRDRTV